MKKQINKRFSVLMVNGILNKFVTLKEAQKYTKGIKDGDFQISEYDNEGKFVKRY